MYIPPEDGKPTPYINPHPLVFDKVGRMIEHEAYGTINRWLKGLFVSRKERKWIVRIAKNEAYNEADHPRMVDCE